MDIPAGTATICAGFYLYQYPLLRESFQDVKEITQLCERTI